MCAHVCVYVCTCLRLCVYTFVFMCVHACVCVYTCVCLSCLHPEGRAYLLGWDWEEEGDRRYVSHPLPTPQLHPVYTGGHQDGDQ